MEDLAPEVRALAPEMCGRDFMREWSVPLYRERFP